MLVLIMQIVLILRAATCALALVDIVEMVW